MRIYPASHYTMGGLWVDYELMTTIPGLYCAGEANFSDHGANRLGASALMQGLADGYFVLPYTISNFLADLLNKPIPGTDHEEFRQTELAPATGSGGSCRSAAHARPTTSTASSARSSGTTAAWSARRKGLEKALSEMPALLRRVLEGPARHRRRRERQPDAREGRACRRLLRARHVDVPRRARREESCGGHFRAEYQYEDGEARRDDENFAHVAAWEWTGDPSTPIRNVEPLEYEVVHFQTRSYK